MLAYDIWLLVVMLAVIVEMSVNNIVTPRASRLSPSRRASPPLKGPSSPGAVAGGALHSDVGDRVVTEAERPDVPRIVQDMVSP